MGRGRSGSTEVGTPDFSAMITMMKNKSGITEATWAPHVACPAGCNSGDSILHIQLQLM